MDTMYWHEECVNKVCDYPNKSEILAFIVSRCRFVTQFFLLLKTQNKFISLSEKIEKEKKEKLVVLHENHCNCSKINVFGCL